MATTCSSALNGVPEQHEIDGVSSYAQAVNDLCVSPLYQEGQPSPMVNYQEGADGKYAIEFHVPDPYILRSALIPFRRIWMESEPSNYFKVRNTFKRYIPSECHWYLDFMKDHYQRARTSKSHHRVASFSGSAAEAPQLAAEDLIELVLNCRFFHSGLNAAKRRYSAEDFETYQRELGPAHFEYMYAISVHQVAVQATNFMEMTEFFLKEVRRLPELREVAVQRFGMPGIEEFDDGTKIRRYSPGYSQIPATPGERLSVLLREMRFSDVRKLLSFVSKDAEQLANVVAESHSLEELLQMTGLSRSYDDLMRGEDPPPMNPGVVGIVRKGNRIWSNGFDEISKRLEDLKRDLIHKTIWKPKRQPLWAVAIQGYGIPFPITRQMDGE